jgi:hypothetical protein
MKIAKPQKKKAVKKQPAKKLIEGKYTHKYLVRLEQGEGEKLTELMQALNTKNYTTATITAIENYLEMAAMIVDKSKEIRELNNRIKKQEALLYGLKTNLKGLFDMPLIEIGNADDDDDDDMDFNEEEKFQYEKYRQTSILDYEKD